MLRRSRTDTLTLVREDLSSVMTFLMRLDAKLERLLVHFDLDDGEEEETED